MTQTRQQAKALVHHLASGHHSRAHLADLLRAEARHRFHRRHALGGAVFATGHAARDRVRAPRRRCRDRHRPALRTGQRRDISDPHAGGHRRVRAEGRARPGARNDSRSVHRARVLDGRRRALDPDSQPGHPGGGARLVGILLYMAYAFRNTQTAAPLRQLGAGGDAARRADRARRLFDPRLALQRPDRRPVHHRVADRDRVQRPRHHRRLRPHPREPGQASGRVVRGRSSTTRWRRRSSAR